MRILRYTKCGLWILSKGNPEKMPSKNNSTWLAGTAQGLTLWVCLGSLSTRPIFFFLLINTLLASLLSIFVENLYCKAWVPGPLSLSTDLKARIWRFNCLDTSLAGNPSPAPSYCRLKPCKIMSAQSWVILTQMEGAVNSPVLMLYTYSQNFGFVS